MNLVAVIARHDRTLHSRALHACARLVLCMCVCARLVLCMCVATWASAYKASLFTKVERSTPSRFRTSTPWPLSAVVLFCLWDLNRG